jgi:type II secretory pathway component PulF
MYVYTARDESGALVKGELEGESLTQTQDVLVDRGLFPLTVRPKSLTITFKLPSLMPAKVPFKMLIIFTRQFYTMFKSGVPMSHIFEALIKQSSHEGLRNALKTIEKDVSEGSTLEAAFAKHPTFFNPLYTSMIRVGEVGGVLENSLMELSKVLYAEHRVQTQVKGASLYPKIVAVVLLVVFVVMMVMVVPVFAEFYANYKAELPLPTRMAIWISDFMMQAWYILLAVGGSIFLIYKRFAASEFGSLTVDKLKFKFPVFGNLQLMVVNARFAHLLSSMYRSGLPIARALDVISGTVGNKAFAKDVLSAKESMERGELLSAAMAKSPYFSPMMVEVTAIAEKSGSMDTLLDSAAQFYDEEIDDIMKNFNTLLEPILLFGVFIFVGFLALAVFLPAWNLTRVLLPH